VTRDRRSLHFPASPIRGTSETTGASANTTACKMQNDGHNLSPARSRKKKSRQLGGVYRYLSKRLLHLTPPEPYVRCSSCMDWCERSQFARKPLSGEGYVDSDRGVRVAFCARLVVDFARSARALLQEEMTLLDELRMIVGSLVPFV
jgi:hypothetical protein